MHEKRVPKWPASLLIVRHGQSSGNVARDLAEANDLPAVDVSERDMDVPLSALGRSQAEALGDWLAKLPPEERPTRVISSSYLRARQTAAAALSRLPESERPRLHVDERLREREFGLIDRLTKKGITAAFPLEAESYAFLGKFYYRPPGGESWCDVILRLRSVLDTLSREHAGERVLIVCHTVVVHCLRYLFEDLTEDEILAIDRANAVANCSITEYRSALDEDGETDELRLTRFNFVDHLRSAGEPVTRKADTKSEARGEEGSDEK